MEGKGNCKSCSHIFTVVTGLSSNYFVVGLFHILEFSFWKGKTIVKAVHTYLL